ncbi:25S rRNA -methyltransferase [Golovinomyces cichoracearum]|uniref:Ribosomal RNA-processing protein 8 n=1 Tax=Golovinomyces cichoracearum TaxID=62708 RepID=A0A420IFY7_9PEZI|nr:25S rRNA -methyltransferase [Golovinomyces cichoracearum]
MFAVPGWSVSSELLKTQTTCPDSLKHDANGIGAREAESLKKRKRSQTNLKLKEINSTNLADLWEEVIEGNPRKNKKNKTRKRDSIRKSENTLTKNSHAQSTSTFEDKNSKEIIREGEELVRKSATSDDSLRTTNAEGQYSQRDGGNQRTEKLKKRKGKYSEKTSEISEDSKENENCTDLKSNPSIELSSNSTTTAISTLTPLQAAMRKKLISSRFRYLNQTLYTTPSSQSLNLFHENPEMFSDYHEGFRRQVEIWPENPVDSYLAEIKSRGKVKEFRRGKPDEKEAILPLPRTSGTCIIADLGCGDAALATKLQTYLQEYRLKIHSFDLHSLSKLVTKADISNLPLPDGSVNVAIFCLALMGTNWVDFIEEAFRVLRWKGELWVAEIKSRFGRVKKSGSKIVEHSVGKKKKATATESKKYLKQKEEQIDDAIATVEVDGIDDYKKDETNLIAFVEILKTRGFVLRSKENEAIDVTNKMFVKMYFLKNTTPVRGKYGSASAETPTVISHRETWKNKEKTKFVEKEPSQMVTNEADVLKPCLYKLR